MTQSYTQINSNGSTRESDRLLDTLARIEGRLARLEATLGRASALTERAPAMLAMLADTLDEKIARGNEAGIDLDERLRVAVRVAERLTTPTALRVAETLVENLESLERFLASGVLAAGPVDVVSKAGAALADVEAEGEPPAIGAWGAFRALSDPDVQRAVGFALEFARRFGKSLDVGERSQP